MRRTFVHRFASRVAPAPVRFPGGRGAAALLLALLGLPGGCSGTGPEWPDGGGALAAQAVERRSNAATASPPRETSAALDELPSALVAEVSLSWPDHPGATGRERFARSAEVVWGEAADGTEWWFERNPLRRDQLAGAQVPAGGRVVLDYGWADLLDGGLTGGWNVLARLGVDEAQLATLRSTGAERLAFGLTFLEARGEPAGDGLLELWWNDEHRVPLRSVRRLDGQLVVRELTVLRLEADRGLLAHPAGRHPQAARMDLCDWHDDPKHHGAHAREGEPRG